MHVSLNLAHAIYIHAQRSYQTEPWECRLTISLSRDVRTIRNTINIINQNIHIHHQYLFTITSTVDNKKVGKYLRVQTTQTTWYTFDVPYFVLYGPDKVTDTGLVLEKSGIVAFDHSVVRRFSPMMLSSITVISKFTVCWNIHTCTWWYYNRWLTFNLKFKKS